MSVDIDAVNERLNGLVTLLKAVGVDSQLDKGDMDRVSKGMGNDLNGLPDTRQLNDDQIEAIIKKLQQAQAEAPQIIAALEAHAEARSLTGGGGGGGGGSTASKQQQHQQQHPSKKQPEVQKQQQQQQQQQQQKVEEEDEDSDEFDEDANYPMVGAGVSDDISVVSDLTTPTVCTGVHVPEEEHYRDTLPPMIIGGVGAPSMIISAPKRKNLVSQVRPGGIAPPGSRHNDRNDRLSSSRPGGAAAARRKNYQDTMAKLHENPTNMGYVGPAEAPTPKGPPSRKIRPTASDSSGLSAPKKRLTSTSTNSTGTKPRSSSRPDNDFHSSSRSTGSGEWDAGFQDSTSKPMKPKPSRPTKKPSKQIDDDGFLVADSFDPFNTGIASSNPFRSSAGDLADPFSSNASASGFEETRSSGANPRTKGKKKPPENRMQSKLSSSSSGGGGGGGGERELIRKPRPAGSTAAPSSAAAGRRRARRASLAM
jgi:hypothetical protein